MRVLFDAHHIGTGQTGNETYARELLRALRDRGGVQVVAAVHRGTPVTGPLEPPTRVRTVPANGWLRLAALGMLARGEHADLVHSIYYRVPLAGRAQVVSIHDVSYERFPQFFSARELRKNRMLVRAAARKAEIVVTLSEHARSEMIELYDVSPNRIMVVPGGVSPVFLDAGDRPRAERSPDEPLRLLAVGTLQPRKNLLRLLDATTIVAQRRPVRLRVIGPPGHQAPEIRARLGGHSEVELLGYVTDDQLIDEYFAADVFVYPSIYEGFGLPIVEAMACGTPVVTSTGGSLPEVAGDGAVVVDPFSVTEIANGIERIADDAALREQLRDRGRRRAATFTWEAAADQLVAAYERALG